MVEYSKKFINKLSVSRIVMYLTLSDIFTWGFYTVIKVLLGLYLESKFNGDAVQYIGIGVAIFFLVKALTEIPIGIMTDKIKTLKDDIMVLFLGNTLMAVPFFFYPLLESPLPYYFLEAIMGLGVSMNLVSWRKTFALSLEKGREGISYAIYDTAVSLVMALLGVIVGYVANLGPAYFDLVMIGTGVFILSSGIWVSRIYLILKRTEEMVN